MNRSQTETEKGSIRHKASWNFEQPSRVWCEHTAKVRLSCPTTLCGSHCNESQLRRDDSNVLTYARDIRSFFPVTDRKSEFRRFGSCASYHVAWKLDWIFDYFGIGYTSEICLLGSQPLNWLNVNPQRQSQRAKIEFQKTICPTWS